MCLSEGNVLTAADWTEWRTNGLLTFPQNLPIYSSVFRLYIVFGVLYCVFFILMYFVFILDGVVYLWSSPFPSDNLVTIFRITE